MSREVCKHGVEIKRGETSSWHPCNDCVAEAQFNAAFPGVRQKEIERKERRAEWIRNNMVAASVYSAQLGYYGADAGANMAEQMADELIKRGYL